MKLITTLGILPLLFFASCGSGQKLQNPPPVAIENTYFETWVAGARGAGSGINLTIEFKESPKKIVLKDVYFKNMKSALVTKPGEPKVYRGYFKTDYNNEDDLVLNSDPKKEYGNKPPKAKKEFPFELKDDEAVISYNKDGKTLFFKITGIIERQADSDVGIPQ